MPLHDSEAFCHANCIVACLITVNKYPTKSKLRRKRLFWLTEEGSCMKVLVTEELDVEVASTIRKQKEMHCIGQLSVHVLYEQALLNCAAQGHKPMIGAAQITGGSSHLC